MALKLTKTMVEANNDDGSFPFTFDNVFGPESAQKDVFDAVGVPLVEDILKGLYKGDVDMSRVTAKVDKSHGGNLQTVLEGLRTDMRKAAENLEFEEAARLRDEVKRLEAVDLAVSDDPLARQSAIEAAGGGERSGGRSTAGRGGMRGGNVKRRKGR